MLRMRIRDLEKQISEMHALSSNTPATPSNLLTESSSADAAEAEAAAAAEVARITAEPEKA